MWDRVCRFAAALLLAFCHLAGATPALAHDGSFAPCHATSGPPADYIMQGGDIGEINWVCRNVGYGAMRERGWLLYTGAGLRGEHPVSHFVTQIARFERIDLIVIGNEDQLVRQSYTMDDVDLFVNGANFALPLPQVENARAVLVAIEKPWGSAILSDARLEHSEGPEEALGWTPRVMMMLAILIGLLISPIIYNYAFFLVLHERFILWHIAMVAGMNTYLVVSSGMIHRFVNLGIGELVFMKQFGFLATVAAAAAFCVNFIEPHAISRKMRDAIVGTGFATLIIGIYASLPVEANRMHGHELYLLSFMPIMVLFITAMVQAAHRHSRAVWFQIYGWTPIFIVGSERIVRGFGIYAAPAWMDQIIYLTLAFEIVLTALGVVDRFDVLRRERDKAEARIDSLASLVDRDALTGLFNRRALEARYPDLRNEGYTALAVIDLDHFKKVNDQFGHSVGDRVLQETAAALSSDPDIISYRLGGEEFLMLMRGPDVAERAERMRRAISIRIANEIDGMDAPVTASLGLVDTTPGVATTLRRVYAHADRLLYEAKNSGRNRMLSERIQLFDAAQRKARGADRRVADRRAAAAEG